LSSFDLRHRVTVNAVYELSFLPRLLDAWPKRLTDGWQISGIYSGQSGLPITPFLSVDSSGTGELNDRPNLVGNPNSGPRRPNQWFNKAAFAQPLPGTFGNSARNVIIGPTLYTVDLSASKLTKVSERASVQFRAEIFNVLNRANFSLPNVDFNTTTFGAISETPDVTAGNPRLGEGGPRVVQFGVKVMF